jgi:hypothetical protein
VIELGVIVDRFYDARSMSVSYNVDPENVDNHCEMRWRDTFTFVQLSLVGGDDKRFYLGGGLSNKVPAKLSRGLPDTQQAHSPKV